MGTPRRGAGAGHRRVVAWLLAAALVAAACTGTGDPAPTPTPSPAESSEPTPSGVQVAVILATGGGNVLPAVGIEERLADLAAERVGDVARIRPVVVDEPDFVPDTAALLADGGADLVCVIGGPAVRTVLDLAERFPASRFCAIGAPREDLPANVDLLELDQEALGHVLGVAAAELAGARPIGLVLGGDTEDRTRRRAGTRAALAASTVVVDAAVADVGEATDLVSGIDEEVDPAVVIVDTSSTSVAEVVAAIAGLWIGPADLATDVSAAVTWSVRVDAIVGAAVDRLVTPDDRDLPTRLGFGEDVFALSFGEGVADPVRDAIRVAADEFARGVPRSAPRRDQTAARRRHRR